MFNPYNTWTALSCTQGVEKTSAQMVTPVIASVQIRRLVANSYIVFENKRFFMYISLLKATMLFKELRTCDMKCPKVLNYNNEIADFISTSVCIG